ncbi:lipocalin-15 [Mauremys reevesii]|uniref:lipocalin-15 n=1 Tax=Mauremys reevesii TaxID=260615 RepID=UPI00193FB454|nr:lipocalin-15 [Mauremys reevesii]
MLQEEWGSPSMQRSEGTVVKMTAMLLSLTLALLGAFQARAEVPVQPDFDAAKFSGMWHIMAAVSNCPIFQKMKDLMKTSAAIVTVTPEDNLHFKIGYPLPDGCKKVELVFEKTGQLGHYTNSQMGKQDMRVVATDYTNYAIVYTFKDDDGKSSTTLQLYSRIQEVNPEAMKTFKELYPPMGLTDDMLVVLPKSDECVKALSS